MKYKQIILIRSDLDMSCGKKCVQVAHASLMACDVTELIAEDTVLDKWKEEGMRKIVLKVPTLEQLREIKVAATNSWIIAEEVCDFGLTQLEPNTVTCLGFEPLDEESVKGKKLNDMTKHLKLL